MRATTIGWAILVIVLLTVLADFAQRAIESASHVGGI